LPSSYGDHVEISPVPTDEEVVAIVAAVQALWPTPQPVRLTDTAAKDAAWRFSRRPWPNGRGRWGTTLN